MGNIKIFTAWGPLMADETTGALLITDADVADLLKIQRPTIEDPAASLATTNVWTEIAIPAGAEYVEFGVETTNAYVVAQTDSIDEGGSHANDPAQNGESYKVNGNFRKPVAGYAGGFLAVKRAGGVNGTISPTWYGN